VLPFWDIAVEPLIRAAGVKTVLEIGARRGRVTLKLIEALGDDAELHVVEPLPLFDPADQAVAFRGRYVFHRKLSLEALPSIPPVDLALIDGDHNWYTVYNELKALAATAGAADLPLPIVLMHDVCWPYGRRDVYYDPSRIPDDFRHEFARLGIRRGRSELVARGGLNAHMHNAVFEGGPRNGVATALEDFLAAYDGSARVVVLPAYFGLAIVVDDAWLEREPSIATVLDRLESVEGREELLAISDLMFTATLAAQRGRPAGRAPAGGASRYLDLLKATLLDELYLENEVRHEYLKTSARRGRAPDPNVLRDPATTLSNELERAHVVRRAGRHARKFRGSDSYLPYADIGRVGFEQLDRVLESVGEDNLVGDFVVCGPGRGGAAVYLQAFADAQGLERRRLWLVDAFKAQGPDSDAAVPTADLNSVRVALARFGVLDERARFLQGEPGAMLAEAQIESIAVLYVTPPLEGSVVDVLEAAYDRVERGGFVVVHHYGDSVVEDEVEAFLRSRGVDAPVKRIGAVGCLWRKKERFAGSPITIAPTPTVDPAKLSVIVAVYDMRRAALRTLHSLSRAYQQDIEELDYEVIVVENGSSPGEELGQETVSSFGDEFRYLSLADRATPSPVGALQAGVDAATGGKLALMIDGAHVLTPGVLHWGTVGLEAYDPAVVATHQWYVGPGQQPDLVRHGYDELLEDRLFEAIGWPADGYELFKIGHFLDERDWLDGMPESNCLFVGRDLFEQAGGLDAAFDMAAAGYANLDLYERLGSTPGARLVTILGEGSFHQVHGGSTTNAGDPAERGRRVTAYREQYEELRGKPFRAPAKHVHYVGRLRAADARTKPRRRYAPIALKLGLEADDTPRPPFPVPGELTSEYVRALWYSRGWKGTRWLGEPVRRSPADLLAYQELIVRLEPEHVIVTGGDGQLPFYLASICELLGGGEVLHVAPADGGSGPSMPRLVRISGSPTDPAVADAVAERLAGSEANLVVLGAREESSDLVREFHLYSPYVPVGGYLVVENTIVGDGVVLSGDRNAPRRALKEILNSATDLVPDRTLEAYGASFNPEGYLRRLSP
jgi:cephalosporin hydroxylase